MALGGDGAGLYQPCPSCQRPMQRRSQQERSRRIGTRRSMSRCTRRGRQVVFLCLYSVPAAISASWRQAAKRQRNGAERAPPRTAGRLATVTVGCGQAQGAASRRSSSAAPVRQRSATCQHPAAGTATTDGSISPGPEVGRHLPVEHGCGCGGRADREPQGSAIAGRADHPQDLVGRIGRVARLQGLPKRSPATVKITADGWRAKPARPWPRRRGARPARAGPAGWRSAARPWRGGGAPRCRPPAAPTPGGCRPA